MKAWKRGAFLASLLTLLVVATLLTGCLDIPQGVGSGYTMPGPNGQQITGRVDSSFRDGDQLMHIDLYLDNSAKGCTFNPSELLVKIPGATTTAPFKTTLSCNNQQAVVQGEVDQQGNVSMTVSGWTS